MNSQQTKDDNEYNGYLVHDFEILYPKLLKAIELAEKYNKETKK